MLFWIKSMINWGKMTKLENANSNDESVKNEEVLKTELVIGSQPLSAPVNMAKNIEDKITRILEKIEARKKARI